MFHTRLAHSSCKSLVLTRDLMAPATLFLLATFLLHSAASVPNSSKYKIPRHALNESYLHESHTLIASSLFSTITLFLPGLTFSSLSLHTSANHPTIALRSSFYSPHRTNSSAYKKPGNLHSLPSSTNLTPLLPIPIFTSFTVSIYTLKN